MQIVIEIPKTLYDRAKKPPILGMYEEIIANGIPLPEHHGRLIDADALIDFLKLHEEYNKDAIYEIANTSTVLEGVKE